jgi:hypothetical protein
VNLGGRRTQLIDGFFQRGFPSRLGEDSLASLIKGIIMFDHIRLGSGDRYWGGESVTPIISLLSEYGKRFPRGEPELAKWIMENRACQADGAIRVRLTEGG